VDVGPSNTRGARERRGELLCIDRQAPRPRKPPGYAGGVATSLDPVGQQAHRAVGSQADGLDRDGSAGQKQAGSCQASLCARGVALAGDLKASFGVAALKERSRAQSQGQIGLRQSPCREPGGPANRGAGGVEVNVVKGDLVGCEMEGRRRAGGPMRVLGI
jgi:hypothetical protein